MEKRYKEALSVSLEALNIRRTSLGAENLDVAATVYNTGQTFQQLKEMDTAIYYYNDFVRIAVPKLGREQPQVSSQQCVVISLQ
jgi:tetratricopeptide (TPR) repeat protein